MPEPLSLSHRIRAPRQLNLYSVLVMGFFFVAALIAVNFENPTGILDVSQTVEGQRAMVNNLSRTAVTLISTVFACLFLAIPLTANIYTPQLISLFVKSWTNRVILSFFVLNALFVLSLTRRSVDVDVPDYQFLLARLLVYATLILIIPYLFSVFRFLDPKMIIARVAADAMAGMEGRPGRTLNSRRDLVSQRIRQLGNIALKALERSDREVALSAVRALEDCDKYYLSLKPKLPDRWFEIDVDHFPGLSLDAYELVKEDRTWVEMEVQRQFGRAYSAALAKVPDVISAISRAQGLLALAAAQCKDSGSLDLAGRHFNNFLREAVKKKDIHAIYDLLYQYRLLARNLWEHCPERVIKIAGYLNYYAGLAVQSGMPFARELVAHDVGLLLTEVADDSKEFEELVTTYLNLGQPASGETMDLGILKARLVAASRLANLGRSKASVARIEETLRPHSALIDSAQAELLGPRERWFWEVTDRQRDFNYLEDDERKELKEFLKRLTQART
ncbi:MAG: DUF2254 family protein [Planctomycetota bacterium]